MQRVISYKATDGREFTGETAKVDCKAHQAQLDATAELRAFLTEGFIESYGVDSAVEFVIENLEVVRELMPKKPRAPRATTAANDAALVEPITPYPPA